LTAVRRVSSSQERIGKLAEGAKWIGGLSPMLKVKIHEEGVIGGCAKSRGMKSTGEVSRR